MFRISREQLVSLEQLAFERFQQQLLTHLRDHFPGHTRYLGEQGLLHVIQRSCALAETHGFETERDLTLYTDLTLMLGSGFDSDPQLEWVPEILQDPILVDPMSRMNALWDQAMRYMEHVLGPDEVLPKRAYRLDRSHKDRWRRLVGIGTLTASNEEALLSYFHDIWPEKAGYVGAPALRVLVGAGREAASRQGLLHGAAQAEFLIHAFVFGHRFHADPQYPWAEVILEKKLPHEQERIFQLVNAFDENLREVLA